MSLSAIAERYAQAIFELGNESGDLPRISRDFRSFSDAHLASEDLRAVLKNPLISIEQREAVLRDLASRLGLTDLALNSVRVVVARHRLDALSEIAARLEELVDRQAGVVRASVTSAAALTPDFLAQLTRTLETATGKKVIVEQSVDASLIAGLVTRIGDNTLDGSLKGRLADLQQKLLQAS